MLAVILSKVVIASGFVVIEDFDVNHLSVFFLDNRLRDVTQFIKLTLIVQISLFCELALATS